MQFHVPQNIDMEDKIIGPLTMRQFLYLLVGGIIDYILFTKMGPAGKMGIALLLGIPIGMISLALAFLKIQDQTFGSFLVALITFSIRPKQRIWHHEGMEDGAITQGVAKAEEEKTIQKKPLNIQEVANLAKVLDTGGETKIDNKVGIEKSLDITKK